MRLYRFFILFISLGTVIPGTLAAQEIHSRLAAPVYTSNARAHDSILALKTPMLEFPETYRKRQLPASVDNSENDYWPGVMDQFNFMSCQQYAGVGYVFGYEMSRLRNVVGWYWENSYPTHYTWNFMNQGEQFGVDFLQSFEVIRQQGQMTSRDYGQDTATSVLGWISGYDKYYRGMSNRLKQVYAIKVNSAEGINTLRNYLYDHLDGSQTGGIACFTTSAGTLNGMPELPEGTPEAGKYIVPSLHSDPNHGLTVVGYNDSIRFDLNEDGRYTNNIDITGDGIVDARDWEIGGFKIANSYGGWWGNLGFTYILYRTFALNYGEGGIWNNRVYVVEADSAYKPLLTVKVNLNYDARNKIRILAGVTCDTLDQLPSHVIDFPVFNFQGGEHVMQGNDTIPESKSIEFGLDVASLLNYITPGQPARFFLMVEERDQNNRGQGNIEHVSFISYQGGPVEFPVKEEGVVIQDNNTTLVSVVATLQKPGVQITTTSLPPYTAAQPIETQLEATGGRPPYDWSFVAEYVKKPTNTPLPQISGDSILGSATIKSFTSVALPFSFPFYGKRFDSVYVNYYGFISFEPQNLPAPYTTDETGMLRMFPLIVPAFSQQYTYYADKHDGNWFQADATRAIIRWKASVSGHIASSTDDFAVILYPDGRFEFCYGTMNNQGFNHTFYKGVSKGDNLNFDIQTQWDANEISGQSYMFYPPVVPEGLTLATTGLLTVNQADPSVMYGLHVQAADAGRISDSKVLMLSSGIEISQELICGDDDRLKSGWPASMKLILKNNGSAPMRNLVIKVKSGESSLLITDSLYTVPVINAEQSLTIPSAFSFKLIQPLPNGFPVMMTLRSQSAARSWSKELVFPVAAPEMVVGSPCVIDGYNGRLDPGEVAVLMVNVKNAGALMAENLQLKLVSGSVDITILSNPILTIDQFGVFSSKDYYFEIKASRDALPGSNASMQIVLSDSTVIYDTLDFDLQIGTKLIALVNLAVSKASLHAMKIALNSLQIGYDTIGALPFNYNRYASIFLILGTASSGSHVLTDAEATPLAAYLQQGGNLYVESYYTWYYLNKTILHPMFKYTTKKIPAYFYPDVKGVQQTFTDSMAFTYSAPVNYAVFSFEPVAPAYSTFINNDIPAKNLEIVYDGPDYKTIGTMIDFSALNGGSPPSTQASLMRRYLEFFGLNISGPYPLFHAGSVSLCQGQQVAFTDDSFDHINSRSWEFQGGTPSVSSELNPVVRYDTIGKFDVKLTVSNGTNTRTILKEKYIQVDHCSGTAEHPPAVPLFRIFPNPATEQVTIQVNRNINGSCKIVLHDLTGRILMEQQHDLHGGNEPLTLNLTGLRKGLYFIGIETAGSISTLKLIRN